MFWGDGDDDDDDDEDDIDMGEAHPVAACGDEQYFIWVWHPK